MEIFEIFDTVQGFKYMILKQKLTFKALLCTRVYYNHNLVLCGIC